MEIDDGRLGRLHMALLHKYLKTGSMHQPQMRSLSFPELAFAVVSRYVSEEDIPHQDLKAIIDRSYSTFRSPGACLCI